MSSLPRIKTSQDWNNFISANPQYEVAQIDATATVHETAVVFEIVALGEGVSVGRSTIVWDRTIILNNTCIGDYTRIYPYTLIGKHCKIENNVVIGSDVRIGDNVHIMNGARIETGATIPEGAIIRENALIRKGGEGYVAFGMWKEPISVYHDARTDDIIMRIGCEHHAAKVWDISAQLSKKILRRCEPHERQEIKEKFRLYKFLKRWKPKK